MRVPGGGFYGWRMGDGDGDGKGNEKKRGKMSALFIHAWVPCNASDPRCFPAVLKRRFAACGRCVLRVAERIANPNGGNIHSPPITSAIIAGQFFFYRASPGFFHVHASNITIFSDNSYLSECIEINGVQK